MCKITGITTAAQVVDHIIPHKGNWNLFWDENNWQSLCKTHHDSAKLSEDTLGYSSACDHDGWPKDPRHPVNARRPYP